MFESLLDNYTFYNVVTVRNWVEFSRPTFYHQSGTLFVMFWPDSLTCVEVSISTDCRALSEEEFSRHHLQTMTGIPRLAIYSCIVNISL